MYFLQVMSIISNHVENKMPRVLLSVPTLSLNLWNVGILFNFFVFVDLVYIGIYFLSKSSSYTILST